ncbi:UNVERIFIED_ORG: hypothetical protein J2Y78_004922 [Buttiauxella agrestis ATCC 33320]
MHSGSVCHNPADFMNITLGWQIKVYFDRQGFTIKIIYDIERSKTAITNQGIIHAIN